MKIDVWSDIACPWCAIGRAHLQQAIGEFVAQAESPDEVDVQWRSFELDPTLPKKVEGDYAARLAGKYGMAVEKAEEMIQQMTDRGASLGVPFDFSVIQSGNTFDAHRLLHLAKEHGVQDAMKGALFTAYFAGGQPIGDAEALAKVAVAVGLPEGEVTELLAGDRFAAEVRADERGAAEIGVRGVPFFVVNERYALSGAQPADVMVQVMQKAWAEEAPAVVEGETCAIDGAC